MMFMVAPKRQFFSAPFLLLAAFTLLTGCSRATNVQPKSVLPAQDVVVPAERPALPARGFFMGVLPTPSGTDSFGDTYKKASGLADFAPVWGRPSPFYELARDLAGSWGQTFVQQYTRGNGMFPIINMSFIGESMTLQAPPGTEGATLSDPNWRRAYLQAALDAVKAVRPAYLSLGNEVNRWYERYGAKADDPNGFQNYVTLYNETYDSVKRLSPQTTVFCVFAREIVSENREADLSVLSMFDPERLDMLVFTTYPNAVQGIRRPADIADDYYSRALKYLPGKPFGLTEAAWPALDYFGGEQAQADFIGEIAGRLTVGQGVKLRLLGWPWLSALDENDPVALVKKDGTRRLACGAWLDLFSRGR
jgi:hypothetical protein